MPTPEQVLARRTRVVVLDVDDQAVRSQMQDAGILKQRKLEEILADGGIDVLDRGLASRLRQEISLAEARGDGQFSYSGPETAQFALRGFVSDISASSRYVAPSEFCDKKGKCTQVRASCTYSGNASGLLKVYELPTLKLVTTFNLRGSASSSTDGGCYGGSGQLSAVARDALEDAVNDARIDLQNLLATKGYVAEKRMRDKLIVFKIMLGRSDGVKGGDPVVFYSLRNRENRLLRKSEQEETTLTTGRIAEPVTDEYAWVIPDDASKVDRIRMGDYVRIQRKKGFFD